MGKKGLLLVFISDYKEGNEPEEYRVHGDEGAASWWIEGTQTNDAPVKYLISKALKDNNKIEKIICMVSEKVGKKGFERFECMVNAYIQSSEELKTAYRGEKITSVPIGYPESKEDISDRAAEVYKEIASAGCIGGEYGAGIYIDYTGGLRDMNFLMTGIIRYLEYRGVSCEEIAYSYRDFKDKSKNRIYSLKCIYSMYQLLNGVAQFVDTGNAELLQTCYSNENDSDTKELLEQIIRFSHAMSLCDVRDVDGIMDELCISLDRFDSKEDKGSFFSVMFGDFTSIIREKLFIEKGRSYSYPRLIKWCLDNNMVQQALTLYIEKMPEFYCNEGILDFSEEMKEENGSGNPGQSWRTEFFYRVFYDQFVGNAEKQDVMPELKRFEEKLKTGINDMKEKNPAVINQFTAKKFRQLKNYMTTPEERAAVERLAGFLKEFYGPVPEDIVFPYSKKSVDNRPKCAITFINYALVQKEWMIYFFYDNEEKYHEYEGSKKSLKYEKYEKKVYALSQVRTYKGEISGAGRCGRALLYDIMKYYLALKMLRNRINHASELEVEENERRAMEQLEKQHGICMRIEFENVKSLIQEGINLCGLN